jgi:hypothetical protein
MSSTNKGAVMQLTRKAAESIIRISQAYQEEKARLTGRAHSKARLLLPALYIPEVSKYLRRGAPQPVPGANIICLDGTRLTFFTDGSLRNSYGRKPAISGRQRRILRKRMRRLLKARTTAQAAGQSAMV